MTFTLGLSLLHIYHHWCFYHPSSNDSDIFKIMLVAVVHSLPINAWIFLCSTTRLSTKRVAFLIYLETPLKREFSQLPGFCSKSLSCIFRSTFSFYSCLYLCADRLLPENLGRNKTILHLNRVFSKYNDFEWDKKAQTLPEKDMIAVSTTTLWFLEMLEARREELLENFGSMQTSPSVRRGTHTIGI